MFRQVGGLAALALAATAGHVLYPTALWLTTRNKPAEQPPDLPEEAPSVTVLIAAYLEAVVIAEKIDDCLSNGYPGELEVLVVADDADTAAAAREAGATVIESTARRGKSAAIAAGMDAAKGEIVVMTDANTLLEPGSLGRMARWFSDPTVGAVAGEKRHTHGSQGAYWAFESWLKQREGRLGATIGLVGECTAVRRSTVPAIPDWVVVDDFWLALAVLESGQRIPYEVTAVATEAPAPDDEEWQRRTRIVAGAIQMLGRRPDLLNPRRGLISFEIWGHRLWRMTFGPLANVALVLVALRHGRDRGLTGHASRAILVVHAAAAVGIVAGDKAPGPTRILGQAVYLQLVGIGGMVRLAKGNVAAAWPKTERRSMT